MVMNNNTELWLPIDGYNFNYWVSTCGRVMSFMTSSGGRLLALRTTRYGYLAVGLCVSSTKKSMLVHRLVATAFILNPEDKPQVNHKNGVKADNNLGNLEWMTGSENQQHAYDTGLNVGMGVTGERNGRATVRDDVVQRALAMYATGNFTLKEVAKESGVHLSSVSRWVRNKNRATV